MQIFAPTFALAPAHPLYLASALRIWQFHFLAIPVIAFLVFVRPSPPPLSIWISCLLSTVQIFCLLLSIRLSPQQNSWFTKENRKSNQKIAYAFLKSHMYSRPHSYETTTRRIWYIMRQNKGVLDIFEILVRPPKQPIQQGESAISEIFKKIENVINFFILSHRVASPSSTMISTSTPALARHQFYTTTIPPAQVHRHPQANNTASNTTPPPYIWSFAPALALLPPHVVQPIPTSGSLRHIGSPTNWRGPQVSASDSLFRKVLAFDRTGIILKQKYEF